MTGCTALHTFISERKKKKKHTSVTHTAKVNIRVRFVAAGLKFRPGICLLLSAGIYLEVFFFFFSGLTF